MDVGIVLDSSGSADSMFSESMKLLENVVYGLDMDNGQVRVAVATFGETYKEIASLTENINFRAGLLNSLPFSALHGRTDIAMALQSTVDKLFSASGDRPGVPNVIILITDGYSTMQSANMMDIANSMKANDQYKLIVVAMGTDPNTGDLTQMVSPPISAMYFTMDSSNDPEKLSQDILQSLCNL